MLALFVCLGMMPVSEPVLPMLATAPLAWDSRADWLQFRERWGETSIPRWDPRDGNPRFIYLPGIPEKLAPLLVADLAKLAHIDPSEFTQVAGSKQGNRAILRWDRSWLGAPVVEQDITQHLALMVVNQKIAGAWVFASRLPLLPTPKAQEIVWVSPSRKQASLATAAQEGFFMVYRDRSGMVLERRDTRHFTSLAHTYEERSQGDSLYSAPARQVTITDSNNQLRTTDDVGYHDLSGSLTVELKGPELLLQNNYQDIFQSGTDSFTMNAASMPYAAASVLHHYYTVRDWLEAHWPGHALLGMQVQAQVELSFGSCNAYYTNGTINFLVEDPGRCSDFGRSADVIFHEYGHGIHHYILTAGTFASDISEGSADFIAATILDDPYLVPGAFGSGSYIREIESDRRYPDDVIGEPHNDGLIWASFLWNLRELWSESMGEEAGLWATEQLFLGALEQGPTFTDVDEAVLMADEDDGDASNGTPHACELLDLLNQHGLGPGSIGVISLSHTPLGPQSSWTDGYEVLFDLANLTPDCGMLDTSRVTVWYTTSGASIGDLANWNNLSASFLGGTSWAATLPRQLAGTRVRYFLSAYSVDGTSTVNSHEENEQNVYEFWVGDRKEVWCEDFESGAPNWVSTGISPAQDMPATESEWVIGNPIGGVDWDPPGAFQGSSIAATVLDGNYSPNTGSRLSSPILDTSTLFSSRRMMLLSFERYLTVEDALYDHARFFVDGTKLYENPLSGGGGGHQLDGDWVHKDYDIEGFVGDNSVELAWELTSDMGLEYGGWQLDHICLVELAELESHYRVHDLVATDEDPIVTISWSGPWIDPLTKIRLIKNKEAAPMNPDDGELLMEVAATPGQRWSIQDASVKEGQRAWYAVFASIDGISWESLAVEGENVDEGGVPEVVESEPVEESVLDSEVQDSDASTPKESSQEPPEDKNCGCSSAPFLNLWLLPGLIAITRKRR